MEAKQKSKVWFRCDRKYSKMFVLNTCKKLDQVPMVGDVIKPSTKDFQSATFRVKPFLKEKKFSNIKDNVLLEFKVVSRKLTLYNQEWELICEPTSESVLYLLENIKTK